MGRIVVDQLEPGMRLGEDLHNRNGDLMAKTGYELTEKLIRAMKMWGVEDVSIQDSEQAEQDAAAPLSEAKMQELSDELNIVFRFVDRNEAHLERLFRSALVYRTNSGEPS